MPSVTDTTDWLLIMCDILPWHLFLSQHLCMVCPGISNVTTVNNILSLSKINALLYHRIRIFSTIFECFSFTWQFAPLIPWAWCFLNIDISQDTVATCFVWWGVQIIVYCKFSTECESERILTRSSAIAEGPRDASCQLNLKSCQLPCNSTETTCTCHKSWTKYQLLLIDQCDKIVPV